MPYEGVSLPLIFDVEKKGFVLVEHLKKLCVLFSVFLLLLKAVNTRGDKQNICMFCFRKHKDGNVHTAEKRIQEIIIYDIMQQQLFHILW